MANSAAPVSVGNISVGGNVKGNIVVGNNNFLYTVHNHYGALVDKHAAPSVKRRRLKQQPPRLPPGFIGRGSDLDKLTNHIKSKDAVLVYGHDGIGKTALVRQAANSDPAKAMPDGVLYIQGVDEKGQALGTQDTIQWLFDALYESNPPLKVNSANARTYLNKTRPLVIINRFEFSSTGLNILADMLPKGALVVTSRNAPGDDGLQHLELLPLAREDSIQLLVNKSGIDLDETTRGVCYKICEMLEDVPLAISKIANIIREKRTNLTSAVDDLQVIQPPSKSDKIQAAIERSYGLVYSVLNREEREALAIAAAAPGISIDRPWLESLAGGEKTSQALESLELLQANSPRLRLAEGLREVIQQSRRDLLALRESQLYSLLGQLKSRALDFEFMSDELGNILGLLQWATNEKRWPEVITLGRAIDPYLTLNGFWDAWKKVLDQILVAGEKMKDLPIQAWTLHQLGTREIGIGSLDQAVNLLVRALRMRESQGDKVGAAYTQHNLNLILPPETPRDSKENPPSTNPPAIKWPIGWIVLILVGIAVIIALYIFFKPPPNSAQLICPMPEGWQVHRVQEGETLDSISQRVTIDYYQDFGEKQFAIVKFAIIDANCLRLPIEVSQGQQLYVPGPLMKSTPVPTEKPLIETIFQSSPTLSLELTGKAEDGDTFHLPSQTIDYTYVIVNTDSKPVEGTLIVKDDRATVTCPEIKLLNPDEKVTCTGTYTVTQVDLDSGSVTNNALAFINETQSNSATLTVHAVQEFALTFTKAADPSTYDHVGQAITYTYAILNKGNVTLSPVQFAVSDDRINESKQFGCSPNITEITPNATVTCSATYNITQADIDAGSVTNKAFAVIYGVRRQLITTEPATTTINYVLPLTLTKTADPTTYEKLGQAITYTYTIKNSSGASLSEPPTLSDDKAAVTCPEINPLAPQGTITCTGIYNITQADLDYGSVTNTAVTSIYGIAIEASVSVKATQRPELAISPVASPTTFETVGQAITYTYVIKNTGNVTLGPTKFMVSDDHINGNTPFACGSERNSLAPEESITCSAASYNINQADIDAGSVTNSATASVVLNGLTINSRPVTNTIPYTCPPPPANWVAYIVQPNDSLYDISLWYGNITVAILQRNNCMGLSTVIYAGNKLYVPYLASITGTVFADQNRNGIQDSFEPPLPGFTVTISSAERNVNRQKQTNGNGIYLFTDLPPGNYTVIYFSEDLTLGGTRTRNFALIPVP